MLAVPSALRQLLLGALAGHVRGSRISFFNDGDCEDFKFDVQGPNGYPDGECTYLKTMGNYSSFMVQRLDTGCDVTIYGPNTAKGICSPGGSFVANIGQCYTDPSWTYYSIDTCVKQSNDNSDASSTDSPTQSSTHTPSASGSVPAASTSASAQAPSSSSSTESNTGAIAGGVIGGIAGLALIIGAAWFLMRRRRRQRASPSGPTEMGGETVVEMSAREVPKPSELAESRYPRYEAGSEPAPQELPAGGDGIAKAVGREEKPPG